jgi:phosphoadenosine phosphosulfate reductase
MDRIDTGPRFAGRCGAPQPHLRGARHARTCSKCCCDRSGRRSRRRVQLRRGKRGAAAPHRQIDPATPVLFLETGKHFPETLAYRDLLVERLGLTDLRNLTPDPAIALAKKDENGLRWSYDPDGCCEIRKVLPLAKALAGFDASDHRPQGLPVAPARACRASRSTRPTLPAGSRSTRWPTGRARSSPPISPNMTCRPPAGGRRAIPRSAARPAPARSPGEDPRSGRWKGWDKTECGIHVAASPLPPYDGELPPGYDPVF